MKPLSVSVEVVGPALAREAVLFLLADMPEVRLAPPDADNDDRILVLMRIRDAAKFPNYDWAHGVLIAGGEPIELLEAAKLGIVVFVHADDEPERLLEALFAATEARPYTTPRLNVPIIRALQLAAMTPVEPAGITTESLARLTPVERQVSAHVARGMQNRQVAAALGLKDRAVKLHLMSVFRKLGITARRELVPLREALEADPPPERRDRNAGGGKPGYPGSESGYSASPRRQTATYEWTATGLGRDPV